MSRWHRSIAILLCAMGILVFLFFQEIAIRLALPKYDPTSHVRFVAPTDDRPLLGPANTQFRQIKNTGDFDVIVSFNSHGFRDDRDVSIGTVEDLYVVGDSFPFGWGVSEEMRVTERIENALDKRVFNLATGGDIRDFRRSLTYAENLGARIRDVILFLDTEVAVKEYDNNRSIPSRGLDEASEAPSFFLNLKATLLQNSAVYFLVTSIVHQSTALREMATELGLIRPSLDAVHGASFSDMAVSSTMEEIIKLTRKYNIFVVVMGHRALWHGDQKDITRQQLARLEHALWTREIEFVALRTAFDDTNDPMSLYFKNDGHWNENGHAVAASAVVLQLKKISENTR